MRVDIDFRDLKLSQSQKLKVSISELTKMEALNLKQNKTNFILEQPNRKRKKFRLILDGKDF